MSFKCEWCEWNDDDKKYVTNSSKDPSIKNDKLRRIAEDLINQVKKEGFISYGYLYKALGLKLPNELYRYKFYTGDKELWKKSLFEVIDKDKESLVGMKANAKGFAKEAKRFTELYERECNKTEELEHKIDILEGLLYE